MVSRRHDGRLGFICSNNQYSLTNIENRGGLNGYKREGKTRGGPADGTARL